MMSTCDPWGGVLHPADGDNRRWRGGGVNGAKFTRSNYILQGGSASITAVTAPLDMAVEEAQSPGC